MQNTGGSVTANAGTNLNTSSLSTSANQINGTQQSKVTDGTNIAAVKAASTAPAATDPSLVVAISPNGGQATSALQTTGNTSLATIATNSALALPAQSGFGVNIGAVQILDANSKAAVLDPCQSNLHSKALVNIVTATSTKIVTGTASKKTYVCGMTVYPAGTTNFAIVEGSGTNCGTSALGLIGGNTAATGIIATAQAGFVSNGGGYSVMAATVNANDVCIITSAAVQLSGVVDYVQQ
jgi:hypothetical protein